VLQDLLPIRRVFISPEIWFELSTEYLECRTLPDTVCSDKTKHLPWSRCRQPVEFEAVGRVAVTDFSLEIGRQINDVDGTERAFLGTDTTADAETFGYIGDLGLRGNLNAELAGSNNRA
jgi:hypothetical protein